MLARRVIAISPDKAVAKRLGLGLRAAGGTVETYDSPDALPEGTIGAALLVLHLQGAVSDALPDLAERLESDASLIVVLPKSNLVDTVAAMQASSKLAGILVADELTNEAVASMASRALYGDIFGLEKVVPWGTRIYSMLVGDYQEKSICIAQISQFANLMGVRRKYREPIEQVLDEMLMNALYDAPVDASGQQLFADVPIKTRISVRMEQRAVVQYACDGERFTISVRDSFGTLDRDTVLKYLHKCLHSEQQIDRKTGGAGLGLYIMANTSSLFLFNVLPGVATEALCTFDLSASKVQLKQFGFFEEKIDPAGRLVGGPSKLLPAGASYPVERRESPPPTAASPGVTYALGAAIVLLVALIGLVAYPRFAAEPTGSLQVITDPQGATIEVDGAARGGTRGGPLLIEDLETGRTFRITASRQGWKPETRLISPVADKVTELVFDLQPEAVTARIDSDPPGAEVFIDNRRVGVTPFTSSDLPHGQQVELRFERTGYRPTTRKVQLPGPGGQLSISHALTLDPNWGSVRITSKPEGATVTHNGTLQAERTPIDEHLVAAGQRQSFTISKPGYQPKAVSITVDPGQRVAPVHADLVPGGGLTVLVPDLPNAKVTVRNVAQCRRRPVPMRDCPLANGTYQIEVVSSRPYARIRDKVTIAGNDVHHTVQVGIVQAAAGHRLQVRGYQTSKVAFPEGSHRLEVIDDQSGEAQNVTVEVQAGQTTTVP